MIAAALVIAAPGLEPYRLCAQMTALPETSASAARIPTTPSSGVRSQAPEAGLSVPFNFSAPLSGAPASPSARLIMQDPEKQAELAAPLAAEALPAAAVETPDAAATPDKAGRLVAAVKANKSISQIVDPKGEDKGKNLERVFDRAGDAHSGSIAVKAAGRAPYASRDSLKRAQPVLQPNEKIVASPVIRQAHSEMRLNSILIGGLSITGLLGSGLFWMALGLPFSAGLAAPLGLGLMYMAKIRLQNQRYYDAMINNAKKEGGAFLKNSDNPELMSEIQELARANHVLMPAVYLTPALSPTNTATTEGYGGAKTLLRINPTLENHPQRRAILAHEMQHVRDLQAPWPHLPKFLSYSALSGLGAAIGGKAAAVLGISFLSSAGWMGGIAALSLTFPVIFTVNLLLCLLMEKRADIGAVLKTGDIKGLNELLGGSSSWRIQARAIDKSLLRAWIKRSSVKLNILIDVDGLGTFTTSPTSAAADAAPAYYQQVPEFAKKLGISPKEISPEDLKRYKERAVRLRPLARWMAHFYSQVKEKSIQRPPNILTIQDLLDWASYIKKFDAQKWPLASSARRELKGGTWMPVQDADGKPILDDGSVIEGARAMFEKTLPSDAYEGRSLQAEVETLIKNYRPVLDQLQVPERLQAPPAATQAKAGPAAPEFKDDTPALLEAESVGATDAPDYIVTKTVRERLEDLMMLYSTKHNEKFFPLLIGDTSEGKSSLIKYMFAQKQMRAILGRSVPVVSIPVKEAMTRRELLGGKGARGIELGFLSLAVANGWVLVLEELNQANGEFLKLLNDVLFQLRKQGYFEFEVGGKTVRVKAHPHFWIVGTENPEEGNYAQTRTSHSPDFLKRWKVRYFSRFPPAEQAEIMRGMSQRWYGDDFLAKHGLKVNFFEKVVTQFHEPLRALSASGKIGGDFQEPYEFNRRTLHRFLKRFLYDLKYYDSNGNGLDDKMFQTLLARELMESYGSELRLPEEKAALWDKLNTVFELESKWGIKRQDIAVELRGFYQKDGKLVADEKLVPIEMPLRTNGGARVPGPEYRLTMVPSLAENVYRSLRNRQFHEPEFSTGPTGTAKTSKQFFITHMLKEPIFSMTLDEQMPMSEFHGGFLKDADSGDFRFQPGIFARAMMYDPEGILNKAEGKPALGTAEIRKSPHIGATLVVNEGNANPNLETMNPAMDDGILNLSDGRHSAVAGGNFHVAVTMNPAGEGYAGYPLTGALKSRGQTVEHTGDVPEEELAEIVLDQLTGVTRYQISDEPK